MAKLPPLPARIKSLPTDHRGFPVPWFVVWFDEAGRSVPPNQGEPDFRVIAPGKILHATRNHRCWICGGQLGRNMAFVIGPMGAINRVSSEPPSHRDCAEFAAKACPFLTKPRMHRNERGLPEERRNAPGIPLDRNPGVALVWVTRSYSTFSAGNGTLFEVGPPDHVGWFAEGRPATRAEVMASIDSGLPALRQAAEQDGPEGIAELDRYVARAMPLLPIAEGRS